MAPAAGRGKQLPSGRTGSASYCTWQHRPSTSTCDPFLCQNASSALFLVLLHLSEVRWMGNIVEWNSPEFSSKTSTLQLYLKRLEFWRWAAPAEVRGLQGSLTERLRYKEQQFGESCKFNPLPFMVRPQLRELEPLAAEPALCKCVLWLFCHRCCLWASCSLNSGAFLKKLWTCILIGGDRHVVFSGSC